MLPGLDFPLGALCHTPKVCPEHALIQLHGFIFLNTNRQEQMCMTNNTMFILKICYPVHILYPQTLAYTIFVLFQLHSSPKSMAKNLFHNQLLSLTNTTHGKQQQKSSTSYNCTCYVIFCMVFFLATVCLERLIHALLQQIATKYYNRRPMIFFCARNYC